MHGLYSSKWGLRDIRNVSCSSLETKLQGYLKLRTTSNLYSIYRIGQGERYIIGRDEQYTVGKGEILNGKG